MGVFGGMKGGRFKVSFCVFGLRFFWVVGLGRGSFREGFTGVLVVCIGFWLGLCFWECLRLRLGGFRGVWKFSYG